VEGLSPIGFRYDEAEVPRGSGLSKTTRREFMISADMVALLDLISR